MGQITKVTVVLCSGTLAEVIVDEFASAAVADKFGIIGIDAWGWQGCQTNFLNPKTHITGVGLDLMHAYHAVIEILTSGNVCSLPLNSCLSAAYCQKQNLKHHQNQWQ